MPPPQKSSRAPLLRRFEVELQVLTPLHIGSGEVLTRDLDYILRGRELLVLDAERILGDLPEVQRRRVGAVSLAQLIPGGDPTPYARYRVPLAPGASTSGYSEVREAIKDALGRPFVPGSSLKGALRTALAVAWAAARGQAWVDRQLERVLEHRPNRKFAAQELERQLFGREPHTDLLRVLRPSDLYDAGERPAMDVLELVEARVVTGSNASGPPVVVEALRPGTVWRGTLTEDLALASAMVAEVANGERAWQAAAPGMLLGAIDQCRRLAGRLIEAERQHFRTGAVAAEYQALQRRLQALDQQSCLVWLGWGTGWMAKTLGELLVQSPHFPEVVRRFGLQRGGRRDWRASEESEDAGAMSRRPATGFPASRRLVVANGTPVQPLGWAQLTLRPVP